MMADNKPLIGICTRNMEKEFFPSVGAPTYYVEAVVRAGGIPLLMPLQTKKEDLPLLLAELDGVIFTGGGDVAVEFYDGEMSDKVTLVDVPRDEFELALVKAALASDVALLGVCRGLQVVNVALGGRLFEDVPSQVTDALPHPYVEGDAFDKLVHAVTIEEDSLMAKVMGATEIEVNSLHHQAIRELGEGLQACAWAADGVIEGAVMSDRDFGILVQWHPECLPNEPHAQQLFAAFVNAAKKA